MSIVENNASLFSGVNFSKIKDDTQNALGEQLSGLSFLAQVTQNIEKYSGSSQNNDSISSVSESDSASAKTNFYAQLIGGVVQESSSTDGSYSQTEQDFLDFAQKSPEERLWEMYLKDEGLTQEEFDALSPEERLKIEEKITKKIEEDMKEAANAYIA
ncbi:MAG: hypothetical protein AB7U85_02930 [Alphaproteobacteria bacterium]